MAAVFHQPGEGERHEMGLSEILIKATREDTGGTFFLSESTIEPGFPGPPPHVHERLHDMFYVLEGTMTIRVGDEDREAGPGTFVCAPPGTIHTFSNRSSKPVRFLNFSTPGGWEGYMRDLASAAQEAGRQLTPEEIGKVAARYDFRRA